MIRAAVVFPGQGSQAPAMAASWRLRPEWELVERAEAGTGEPIASWLTDPDRPPTTTSSVQLCVLLTSLMAWEAARPAMPAPVVLAGHSMGQITALAAAGVLSFEDAVRVIVIRGQVTEQVCRREAGAMSAVLALPLDRARWACSAAPGRCWLANDNAPGQVVLAGTEDGLGAVEDRARELGARKIIRLVVEGAFHTPMMIEAARQFRDQLRGVRFGVPTRPLISNADAALITAGGPVWGHLLADHLVEPVQWRRSQLTLPGLGVDTIVEFGHGTTLTSIAKRTVPHLEVRNVDSPDAAALLADELHPGYALPAAAGSGGPR